jgi:hypothetical protein
MRHRLSGLALRALAVGLGALVQDPGPLVLDIAFVGAGQGQRRGEDAVPGLLAVGQFLVGGG